MSTAYIPRLGDDLFTASNGWFGPKARWFSTHRGEEPSLASHQGKFYSSGYTVEATFDGVKKLNWLQRRNEMYRNGDAWAILTPVDPLNSDQMYEMHHIIKEMIGWKYSHAEIGLQLLDGLIGKVVGSDVIAFRRLGDLWRNGVICSKTANRPDIKLNLLPKRMEYASPDCTWDYKIKSGRYYIADKSMGWGS